MAKIKPTTVLIGILLLVTVLSGIQYLNRTFGVGPELYLPVEWLVERGLVSWQPPASPPAATPSATPNIVPLKPAFGGIMAVPLTVPDMKALIAYSIAINTEGGTAVNSMSIMPPVDELAPTPATATASAFVDESDSVNATLSATAQSESLLSGDSDDAFQQESINRYASQLESIRLLQPAVVVLFGSEISVDEASFAIKQVKSASPDSLIAVDHEGGTVQRLNGDGFTPLPSWRSLCASNQATMLEQIASSAAQLREVGVDVVLGPVVDVAQGGSLGSRVCSTSPELVASRSAQVIQAFQQEGIGSVLKHFPGLGGVKEDLHTATAKHVVTDNDLQPYEEILTTFPSMPTMVSFIRVASVDEENPCALSQYCLNQFSQAFPKSLIITDALEMDAAGYVFADTLKDDKQSTNSADRLLSLPERSRKALEAGADLLLFGPTVTPKDLDEVVKSLEARYTDSVVLEARFTMARNRVKAWQQKGYAR